VGAGSHLPDRLLEFEHFLDRQALEFRAVKRRFLESLGQEIRMPVHAILGITDLLLETDLDVQQREQLLTARICAQELAEKLQCTLEYGVLAHGNPTLPRRETDLVERLESLLLDHSLKARLNGIDLVSSFDPDMPALVEAPEAAIVQIVGQLLGNALRHTATGEVELTGVAQPAENGFVLVRISVRDTGSGMPPETLESIQACLAPRGRTAPPAGLGLTMAARLASLAGGSIEVESVLGCGSRFTLSLPVRDLPGGGNRWATELRGRAVAVLTPNRALGSSIAGLLASFGIRGHAGSLQTAPEPPWAVIAEPGAGLSAREIRGILRTTPAIVTLGWPGDDPLPGSAAFLEKPVRRYPLHDTLLHLC
jgi:hypothetical protein